MSNRKLIIDQEVDDCSKCLCAQYDEGYGTYCNHPEMAGKVNEIILDLDVLFPDFCPLKEVE